MKGENCSKKFLSSVIGWVVLSVAIGALVITIADLVRNTNQLARHMELHAKLETIKSQRKSGKIGAEEALRMSYAAWESVGCRSTRVANGEKILVQGKTIGNKHGDPGNTDEIRR